MVKALWFGFLVLIFFGPLCYAFSFALWRGLIYGRVKIAKRWHVSRSVTPMQYIFFMLLYAMSLIFCLAIIGGYFWHALSR